MNPPSPHQALADIGDFLAALRSSGIPIGPGELARLQHLFERSPRLDRDGLKTLLAGLLVKTPEQRETFERLFADWCPDRDAAWPAEGETAWPEPDRSEAPTPILTEPIVEESQEERSSSRPWWQRPEVIAAALLVVGLLVWLGWPPSEKPVESVAEPEPPTEPALPLPSTPAPPELPADPVKEVWFWRAEIHDQAIEVPARIEWPWLVLLGLAALVIALWAWWRYREKYPEIKPQPPRRYLGFGWQPLPPPERDESALVGARDRRQLIWNVERFVSDDPTRRLDLTQTVDATARAGGYVQLCFEPAAYEREIWFWLDRQLTWPTPRTATEQLLAALDNAGLRARRGFFTELPRRVDWPGQPGFRPEAQESQGRQALVAILTDGEGLARRLANLREAGPTQRLLRALRRWPRLCFVDCSAQGDRLAPLLAPYGLDFIALEQLPHWLGGVTVPAPPASPLGTGLYGPEREWAAVVALGGTQADAAGAHCLRAELKLRASPWQVDRVLAVAQRDRPALINWLLRHEPLGDDGLPQEDSLAGRALAWWQRRYGDAARRMRDKENPLLPWWSSLASRRWQLEQALLQLYREPVAAANKLVPLADDELRDEIRERLAEFADDEIRERRAGSGDNTYVFLTWRLADLPPLTRHRLRWLGFAAELYRREPPPLAKYPPRLVLVMSTLIALGVAAFAVAGYRAFTLNPPRLVVDDREVRQAVDEAPTVNLVEPLGGGQYRVTVGSPRHTVSMEVAEGARVPVSWYWGEDNEAGMENALGFKDSASVVLRAGSLAQPIRACGDGWPQRSLVVIADPYDEDHPAARQLAIRLLNRGSADQVLIGTDWSEHLDGWLGRSRELNEKTQLLVVLPDRADAENAVERVRQHSGPWAVTSTSDFAELARAIEFWEEGAKPVRKMDEHLRVQEESGEVMIAGGPGWTREERTGIEWVKVCRGTFTMGSDKDDKMAYEDELVDGVRVVTLTKFEIARTETTNEQYKRLRPEHDRSDRLPVVYVNWEQARSYCRDAGGDMPGDLPTEAQWEYTARGGSQTAWSFGDGEKQLGNYAWYEGNSSYQAQEVRQKMPNPLGLYDMHGNVWEWTRDWYDDYTSGVFVDPLGSDLSSGRRVVRGGSFDDPPGFLRSANRDGGSPEVRLDFNGFRCVRVPPQP